MTVTKNRTEIKGTGGEIVLYRTSQLQKSFGRDSSRPNDFCKQLHVCPYFVRMALRMTGEPQRCVRP